jgi:hypothetical protein
MKHSTKYLRKAQAEFKPTYSMRMCKQRFLQALEDNATLFAAEDLDIQQIAEITGTPRVVDWARDQPSFLFWILDKDYTKHNLRAIGEEVVDALTEILRSDYIDKTLTAKDRINAGKELLAMADMYPNKRKEITYLDKSVAALTEEETDREIEAVKRRLLEE